MSHTSGLDGPQSRSDALRRLRYFAEASDPCVASLAGAMREQAYAAGEMLFLEGSASSGLWLVRTGRVKVYRVSPDGGEYVIRVFGPGDTFNEIAAIDGSPNPVTAAGITEGTAWVIPARDFGRALVEDHALALAVVRELSERLRRVVGQSEDLALRSVTARLARFLLEQASDPAMAHPAVTRALLADHLATTSESISRSLRTLEVAGAIAFDRHRIVVVRPDVLADLAQV